MKMKIIICLLIIVSAFTIVGCNQKKDSYKGAGEIVLVSNIDIGKKQYIEQLKKITIADTNDYVIITSKVKWEEPDTEENSTVSFTFAIPYTLHVDGKDYSSVYYLGDYQKQNKDGNPKYDFEVTDLTDNYETEILVKKK